MVELGQDSQMRDCIAMVLGESWGHLSAPGLTGNLVSLHPALLYPKGHIRYL